MQPNHTPPPDIAGVQITADRLTFDLQDGRSVSVPLAHYPTLLLATPEKRDDFEICHSAVHSPNLQCDISSECLLRGAKEARRFAAKAWQRHRQAV